MLDPEWPAKDGYSSLRPDVLKVPGVDQDNVLVAWDVFERSESLGEKIIVVADEPHLTGAYIAEHLAENGHSVRLVTPQLYPEEKKSFAWTSIPPDCTMIRVVRSALDAST